MAHEGIVWYIVLYYSLEYTIVYITLKSILLRVLV